jgi:hypothetical protein
MSEQVIWDDKTFKLGDTFRLANDRKVITLLDIVESQGIYVVLRYHTYPPMLMKAEEFAYYVDADVYRKTSDPIFKPGERFVHQLSNDTLEVLYVSPRESDATQNYTYFSVLTNEAGSSQYVSVDEPYIQGLIRIETLETIPFPAPEIPVDATFPTVIHETNPSV